MSILKNKDFNNFNFNNINLGQPSVHNSSSGFFSRIYNNGESLYIQTNETFTKQGIIETKKPYIDLMFPSDDNLLIDFLEKLETDIMAKIYSKKDIWFHNPIELEDIENSFISSVRLYKSGKFYLIRTNFNNINNNYNLFNEQNEKINPSLINEKSKIISILEIQGVKFTQKSFKLEIINKQILLIDEANIFNNCMISNLGKNDKINTSNEINSSNNLNNTTIKQHINDSNNEDLTNNEEPAISEDLTNNEEPANNETNDYELITNENEQLNQNILTETTTTNDINTLESQDLEDNLEPQISQNNLDNIQENESIDTSNTNTLDVIEKDILEIENLELDENDDPISLKKPEDFYKEIYKIALEKAKKLRQNALDAYLEAKKIKNTHLIELSDNDSEMSFSDFEN